MIKCHSCSFLGRFFEKSLGSLVKSDIQRNFEGCEGRGWENTVFNWQSQFYLNNRICAF